MGMGVAWIGRAYLVNPEKSLIDAGMAWATGESGKVALRNWAAAWGRAHVKAGESEKSAKQAAEQTAAFYTGEA